MSDDPLDFLKAIGESENQARRATPRRKQLTNPLEVVPTTEVRRALHSEGKDPSMVGQQLRRSILIPPEMDDEINRVCRRYNVKKMEMLRYLIAKGLEQIHRGALEGNLVPRVTMELPMPDWKGK